MANSVYIHQHLLNPCSIVGRINVSSSLWLVPINARHMMTILLKQWQPEGRLNYYRTCTLSTRDLSVSAWQNSWQCSQVGHFWELYCHECRSKCL